MTVSYDWAINLYMAFDGRRAYEMGMRKTACSVGLTVLHFSSSLAWTRPAGADTGDDPAAASGSGRPSSDPLPATGNWYGAPIVVSDGISSGLAAGGTVLVIRNLFAHNGAANVGAVMALMGVTGYTFGGPFVHALNGEWGHAAASLGLRAIPWVLLGLLRTSNNDETVGNTAFVASALGVMAIDSSLLAYSSGPPSQAHTCWHVVPRVMRHDGSSLSLRRDF